MTLFGMNTVLQFCFDGQIFNAGIVFEDNANANFKHFAIFIVLIPDE